MTRRLRADPGRRAIVFGASGFIGSALTKRMVAEGWSVIATVRGSMSPDWTEGALAGAQVEVLSPTRNPRAMTDLLIKSKPHVAIICSGVAPVADPTGIPGLVEGNVALPAVVLEACSRAG